MKGHAVNTVAILEAHLSVLKLLDPPQSVIGWTITALRHIYNACSCTQDITVSLYHSYITIFWPKCNRKIATTCNWTFHLVLSDIIWRLTAHCPATSDIIDLHGYRHRDLSLQDTTWPYSRNLKCTLLGNNSKKYQLLVKGALLPTMRTYLLHKNEISSHLQFELFV